MLVTPGVFLFSQVQGVKAKTDAKAATLIKIRLSFIRVPSFLSEGLHGGAKWDFFPEKSCKLVQEASVQLASKLLFLLH